MEKLSIVARELSPPIEYFQQEVPLLAGITAQAILVGIFLSQISSYAVNRFRQDSLQNRLFVGLILILVLLKFASEVSNLQYLLVSNYGLGIVQRPFLIKLALVTSFFPIFLSQLWFLERFYRISKSATLTLIGFVLTLCSGAGYIAEVTIRVMDFSSAITTIERIQVGIQIYSWFTLLSSSFVTCLSARYLYKSRNESSSKRFVELIEGATIAGLEAGIAPALCSLGMAVSALSANNTLSFIAFQMNLSVIFGSSVLFVLNSQKRITEEVNAREDRFNSNSSGEDEAPKLERRFGLFTLPKKKVVGNDSGEDEVPKLERRFRLFSLPKKKSISAIGAVTVDYEVELMEEIELPAFLGTGSKEEEKEEEKDTQIDPRRYHESFA